MGAGATVPSPLLREQAAAKMEAGKAATGAAWERGSWMELAMTRTRKRLRGMLVRLEGDDDSGEEADNE